MTLWLEGFVKFRKDASGLHQLHLRAAVRVRGGGVGRNVCPREADRRNLEPTENHQSNPKVQPAEEGQ